ncbi:MAG: hypothetical protein KA314_04385 [Chloroflexi bacterium]|nr:hypothetical protein [Chloroflexota bacterium]MBP8055051.1 hypothetical protein [Chloroflexota bacterium]
MRETNHVLNDTRPQFIKLPAILHLTSGYTAKGHNLTFSRRIAVPLYRPVGNIRGHPHP